MSSSGTNGTVITTGPELIQVADFYVSASILHPIVIGSIAVIALFIVLRVGSNRSVAPITVFDWLINVALGSTLAGIVNGNSLVRGLLGLFTMLTFQYVTSYLTSHYNHWFGWILASKPLVIAFRGRMLEKVMMAHRISEADMNRALRQSGILNISQVECVVIEPTGKFSVFAMEDLEDAGVAPETLMDIPAYRGLWEDAESKGDDERRGEDSREQDGGVKKANDGRKRSESSRSGNGGESSQACDDEQNKIAGDAC